MADILHLVIIKAPPDLVFSALTTLAGLAGWWTEDVHAEPKAGSIARFHFADRGGSDMEILRLDKSRLVHRRCVAHQSSDEWVRTEIFFDLQAQNDATTVRFSHRRWLEASDFFRYCSEKWAVYLVSLKNFVETGRGSPWPHDIPI
jgi:uncharacterized protein YndB with AHSA1/START domain